MAIEAGATQTEGANPNNEANKKEEVERQPTARELAMEAAVAKRNAEFEEESGVKLTAPTTDDDDPDEVARAAAAAQLAAQAAATGEDDDPDDPKEKTAPAVKTDDDFAKRKVKVKIDGEEQEVSVEDMQREYQKGRTADKRLAEATRMKREAEELQKQQLAQQSKDVHNSTEVVIDPEIAKEFTGAIFKGEEEKAATAFTKAVAKAVQTATEGRQKEATQTVDADEVARTVEQRLAVNSALKQSRLDYPELYADADLNELGAAKIRRKQNEGMDFIEALESTGKELATKFGWKSAGHQKKPDDSTARKAKLEDKKSLDNVSGASVKNTTQEAAPVSNSAVIAEMARLRGQSTGP